MSEKNDYQENEWRRSTEPKWRMDAKERLAAGQVLPLQAYTVWDQGDGYSANQCFMVLGTGAATRLMTRLQQSDEALNALNALTRERDEAVRERDELRAANEVIERIVGGDQCELWDMENAYRKFRGKAKEMHELLNAVYRISHSVSRQNSCYHVHESWRQEIVTLADSLTTDKAAQETKDGEG